MKMNHNDRKALKLIVIMLILDILFILERVYGG